MQQVWTSYQEICQHLGEAFSPQDVKLSFFNCIACVWGVSVRLALDYTGARGKILLGVNASTVFSNLKKELFVLNSPSVHEG